MGRDEQRILGFPQAAGAGEASVALEAAARKEPQKERTPEWTGRNS